MQSKQEAWDGFLACALWSSQDEDHGPYNDAGLELGPGEEVAARAALDSWLDTNEPLLDTVAELLDGTTREGSTGWELIGHNVWLNLAGHGTGFWDRDALDIPHLKTPGGKWTTLGEYVGVLVKELAQDACLYVGDDGKLYFIGLQVK